MNCIRPRHIKGIYKFRKHFNEKTSCFYVIFAFSLKYFQTRSGLICPANSLTLKQKDISQKTHNWQFKNYSNSDLGQNHFSLWVSLFPRPRLWDNFLILYSARITTRVLMNITLIINWLLIIAPDINGVCILSINTNMPTSSSANDAKVFVWMSRYKIFPHLCEYYWFLPL